MKFNRYVKKILYNIPSSSISHVNFLVSWLFTQLKGFLIFVFHTKIVSRNWCILLCCLPSWPCQGCAIDCLLSFEVIRHNSANPRSYGELYIWAWCWFWRESIFWCFSTVRATTKWKQTNVNISTHTNHAMWNTYTPIFTVFIMVRWRKLSSMNVN